MMLRSALFAALILTGGLAAPAMAAPRPPAVGDAASDAASKAVVEALYTAFAANDAPGIARVLDQNVMWVEAENGPYADHNPYAGTSAVFEGVFGRIGVQFRDFRATPQTYLPSGDKVVVLGRYSGSNISTGEALDAQFAHVFTVANGKVTAFQQYTDTAQWMDAVTPD